MVMKKSLSLYIASFFALIISLHSSAAFATNIQVTVNKNKVVKNEVFQLRIVVDKKVDSSSLDFTALEQDFYMGRPSFGSSINIINGDRSNRSEWNISLAAQRLGVATIPAFTINGVSSKPIKITVSQDNNEPLVSDLVEVQSELNRSELYPNESATLTTRLIVKADPRRLQNANITPPTLTKGEKGAITLEALGEPNQYQSVLDGVEVTVVDQSYRITAKQAGEFSLKGIGFAGSVVYGDNRTGTTKLVSANTPAKTFSVTVLPIPTGYQGHWLPAESLNLEQRWSDSDGNSIDSSKTFSAKVGDSISREITVDISGLAAEHIPDLNIQYPESVRVYEEKPQFQTLANGATRMTLKQVIIAQQQGSVELNNIDFQWWNSRNKASQTSTLTGLTLDVAAGSSITTEAMTTPISAAPTAQTITVYERGIWPYLTALFALLWLATLVMLILSRRAKPPAKQQVVESSSEFEAIKQALKAEDKVLANLLISRWLNKQEQIEPEVRSSILEEQSMMNESQYAANPIAWTPEKLIKLIKLGEKSVRSKKSQKEDLPKL